MGLLRGATPSTDRAGAKWSHPPTVGLTGPSGVALQVLAM